jgi:hypothetical protein
VLRFDGHGRVFPDPPRVPPVPDALVEDYGSSWEFIAGLRCHATRRVQFITSQRERPGIYNAVVADDWDTLRARLVEQAEREAQMA